MARYQKATATVLGSRIGTAIGHRTGMTYYPEITYQYSVNGMEYVNNRFAQNLVGNGRQAPVQKILDKHPQGSSIQIYYNVDNPPDSYVQKGFGRSVNLILYLMLFGSLALLVFALLASGTITF